MDKTIDVLINGSYVTKNSNTAGVQGEGNAGYLHITFDEGWSGLSKSITFWDSRGENPVKRTLTNALLVDIAVSLLEYNVPIPAEPLVYEGKMTFVIDGYKAGARKRTAQDSLLVLPSMQFVGNPADPTPTQAEQLQGAIEKILPDVQAETVKAQTAAQNAEEARDNALLSAEKAENAADRAQASQQAAAQSQAEAKSAESGAKNYSLLSQSYAVGGTGTRGGENEDNARYYAQKAQAEAESVRIPPAEGVYNIILADRITGARYALIVENAVLMLLGVSDSLKATEILVIDRETGTANALIVESGVLKLEEVE